MRGEKDVSLCFEYDDIKYIIVKTREDFEQLSDEIANLGLNRPEERRLFSKIIIWLGCQK